MSTSPDCSAVKRCCEESGTNLTLSASPKIAAATARQTSTSRPTHLPWLSAIMKPAVPWPTPQTRLPRALIASRSLPAIAVPAVRMAVSPTAAASVILCIPASRLFPCPECRLPNASKQQAKWQRPYANRRPKGRRRIVFGEGRSADRRGVLQAALGPQRVQATLDLERAAHADVAVEALAVVTDLLDDVVDPLLVDAERLAHARRRAEDALDGGIVALQHLVDVLGRDAVFLRLDHGVERPAHDVGELVVALAHRRTERLLGDDLRQDDEVLGLGRRRRVGGAGRIEARRVGGVDVATAGIEGGADLLDLLDDHRLEAHLVGAEVVGEVELGGGAGLHADGGAVQLLGALHAELLGYHEALAVVVVDAGEVEAERGVALQGVGGVARQDVDLARLQRGKALLRRCRHVLDLLRIAEQRRRDGAADIDVEAGPLALVVLLGEAGD